MSKERFRQESLRRLRGLSRQKRYRSDHTINDRIYAAIMAEEARSVMLYVPLPMEVNVLPLIRKLRRLGVAVLVPFMEGASFRLVKYRLPLARKQFGIKEPKFSNKFRKKKIDIAIVPIVGTDATGRRVGFGKGMYDRFFERHKYTIGKVVLTQRQLCLSDTIVTDDHDVQADIIITAG